MTLTVLYDNNPYHLQLRTAWGFSCLIQRGETTVLFDTGGDGGILLSNMSRIGLASMGIRHVVLSHTHGDHTGGLGSLLATGIRPAVWVPRSFPAVFRQRLHTTTEIHEVSSPTTITGGIHSTGELGSRITEQSLVLESDRGLVLVTGCAHPGIVSISSRVRELHQQELHLIVGGLHLGGYSDAQLRRIATQLRDLGVQKIAPCHCTGDQAMRVLAQEWGADYLPCGVGRVIEVPL